MSMSAPSGATIAWRWPILPFELFFSRLQTAKCLDFWVPMETNDNNTEIEKLSKEIDQLKQENNALTKENEELLDEIDQLNREIDLSSSTQKSSPSGIVNS